MVAIASSSATSHAMFETASRNVSATRAFLRDELGNACECLCLRLDVVPRSAEQRGVSCMNVVARRRRCDLVRELEAEAAARDVGDAHRLRRQMHELEIVVERDVDVGPQPIDVIKLESAA